MKPPTVQYLIARTVVAHRIPHLSLLLYLVLASSAGSQVRSSSEVVYVTDAERLFVRATGRYERGEYVRALKDYVKLSEMRPNQRTTAGLLMMSMAQMKLEQYNDALATAKRLDRQYQNSRYAPDSRLVAGDCYYYLRRYYEAADKYARLLATPAPLDLQASAAERLAGVIENSAITVEAQDLIRLQVGESRMRDALLFGEARWYIRLGWDEQARVALERYVERVPNGIFTAMARRSLQTAAASPPRRESPARDVDEARETALMERLELTRSGGSPPPRLTSAGQEEALVGSKPRLGVLLPLSGPDGDYGDEILAGIRLANEDAGDLFDLVEVDTGLEYPTVQVPDGSERLKIVQSEGGKLIRTLQGVRRLVQDKDVVAIIGPIFSTSSVVAAAAAENAGVPLITPLAQQSGLDSLGDFIFQLSVVSEVQASALAEHATLVLGMKTLVVLAPLTDYGWSFARAFEETAEANGGKVVTSEWYVPQETTDFKNQFQAIREVGFRLTPPPGPADTLAVLDSLSLVVVDTAFEGEQTFVDLLESSLSIAGIEPDSAEIFIDTIDAIAVVVESFDDAKRIAPQLTFFRFDTQMLGNDIWYEPEAIRQMSRSDRDHIKGCIFVSGRREASAAERDFTDRFRSRYGTDPLYAGFGYDAVSIVAAGWHKLHDTRGSMREWLSSLTDYDGASGRIGFSPGRRVNDELSLLKIDSGGRLVPLVIDDLPDMSVPVDDLPALDMLDSDVEFEFTDEDSLFLSDGE